MKCSLRHMVVFLGLLSLVLVLSIGCKEDNNVKQFMEVGNALAKNINQLSKEPGIAKTGFASNPDKKLFKVGIGIDHTKITSERLKQVVESYLNNAASSTSEQDPQKMLEPYDLQIEEIDKDKNTTSLIAEKPSGSTEISWKEDNIPPLPISTKQTAENQITIPFPYTDQFPNGIEQWLLDRDTSNHFVLKVLFRSKEVAAFPVNPIGINQVTGKITLGGKEYSVTSITLNNDQTSGQITLQNGIVSSPDKSILLDESAKTSGFESRIDLLEKALAPMTSDETVQKWAEGVRTRNGALQFAMFSPKVKEKELSSFEKLGGWITGVSSPWAESYEISKGIPKTQDSFEFQVKFSMATSDGKGFMINNVLVQRNNKNWYISEIRAEDGRILIP